MARQLVCTVTEQDFKAPSRKGQTLTHRIAIARALGRVQAQDVGKRVYNVGTHTAPVYQVENTEQMQARQDKTQ